MKKQNIGLLTTIALAASLATGASTASAAGLLGQRYIDATLDYVFWDNDSGLDHGLGVTVDYNQPLTNSLDLTAAYSYLSSDISNTSTSVKGNDLSFGAHWFMPAANGKFFTGGKLGWSKASANLIGSGNNLSESTTYWLIDAGYEFPIGSGSSATPYISYSHAFKRGFSGTFEYGIYGEFDLSGTTSLLMKVNGNDDSDFGVSGGVVYRF